MQENWVDFKAVKSAVSMEMILSRYQVNWLRKSGEELRGRCPIHQGEGQDTFHVSLAKNAFHCFSCKARGNVLDLVAAMEKCSVRDAAIKLAEWFTVKAEAPARAEAAAPGQVGESAAAVNKPLKFQLKGVDTSHPYLLERGMSKQTAELFGVGFFAGKGSMHGRVVIPIHNERGELVAYAGRAIDGSEPRYKLPKGFHKSVELFNLHRAIGETNEERFVVVVEGFFDCMKVSAAGFPCVALMGCSLSEHQERLLLPRFTKVTLLMDGDTAGQEAGEAIVQRLVHKVHVRFVELPEGSQPDQLATDQLAGILK
jgi:DNA primase